MVDISIEAGHMELDDLRDLWEKEVAAARGAMESGLVKSLYKVVGQRRVVGILEADDHDMLDRIAVAGLPMANYLVFNSRLSADPNSRNRAGCLPPIAG